MIVTVLLPFRSFMNKFFCRRLTDMVPTVAIIAWKHSHGVNEHGLGRTLAWQEHAASRTIPAEPGVAVRRIPGGKQKFESAMIPGASHFLGAYFWGT